MRAQRFIGCFIDIVRTWASSSNKVVFNKEDNKGTGGSVIINGYRRGKEAEVRLYLIGPCESKEQQNLA